MQDSGSLDAADHSSGLARVIGVRQLALLSINFIIGSGIFGLPGLVAGVLGPAAVLAYLVVAALMVLVGLCFAEAGSRVTGAGGLYAYAYEFLGPVVGGVTGTLLWLANSVVPSAAVANLMVDTLTVLFPALAGPAPKVAVICAAYAGFALVNIRGARQGAGLSTAMACLKLAPLLLLVAIGAFSVHGANLAWDKPPAASSLGEAGVIVFFAFMGIEGALSASGEVRRPARTIPLAILLSLGSVALLYIALQTVAQGVLGAALAGSATPLVDLANALLGSWGGRAVAVAVLLSVSGYLAADAMSSPRTFFAMAERGQAPAMLARVHPRFGTPVAAIAVYASACALVACTGSFRQLVILASAGTLTIYLICCLGLLSLRARKVAMDGEPFRAPGGPFTPLAAAAIIVWLLTTLKGAELASVAAMVVVSGAVYAVQRRFVRA